MTIYEQNGHANRRAYLESLAEDYGVPVRTVFALASILGPSEDFDGLVTSLEDEADRIEMDMGHAITGDYPTA